jgi:hypothetical protein
MRNSVIESGRQITNRDFKGSLLIPGMALTISDGRRALEMYLKYTSHLIKPLAQCLAIWFI